MRSVILAAAAALILPILAEAQSPNVTAWVGDYAGTRDARTKGRTFKVDIATEYRCPEGGLISGVRCADSSCRPRQYRCTTGFETGDWSFDDPMLASDVYYDNRFDRWIGRRGGSCREGSWTPARTLI